MAPSSSVETKLNAGGHYKLTLSNNVKTVSISQCLNRISVLNLPFKSVTYKKMKFSSPEWDEGG